MVGTRWLLGGHGVVMWWLQGDYGVVLGWLLVG